MKGFGFVVYGALMEHMDNCPRCVGTETCEEAHRLAVRAAQAYAEMCAPIPEPPKSPHKA